MISLDADTKLLMLPYVRTNSYLISNLKRFVLFVQESENCSVHHQQIPRTSQICQLKRDPFIIKHVLFEMIFIHTFMSRVKAQVQIKDEATKDPGLIITMIS